MPTHDHDVKGGQELRPKAARIEVEDPGLNYRAAAAGRMDVLGPAGLLGLQRAAGNAGVGALVEEERTPVLDVINSGRGSPLDTDTRAHDSVRAINAHASTVGLNLVQRQEALEEQEEPTAQGSFVQRQGEEEEEAPE
jgi:hypothetical protein